jgi:hypothetical protein
MLCASVNLHHADVGTFTKLAAGRDPAITCPLPDATTPATSGTQPIEPIQLAEAGETLETPMESGTHTDGNATINETFGNLTIRETLVRTPNLRV